MQHSQFSPRRAPARGAAALLFAAFCACAPVAARADVADGPYRLQPGDSLRMAVIGVPELAAETEIDIDGYVVLPQVGRVRAVDRTIVEIETEVRDRITGQTAKRYGAEGAPIFIPLSGTDVTLGVTGYRPIVVAGDVRRPGLVAFSPDLTVRAALAIAGGVSAVAALGDVADAAALRAPRLQAEHRSRSFENAALRAELWRIDAALARDPERPAPADPAPVSAEAFADMIEAQRRQLRADLQLLDNERRFLERAIAESDRRREVLTRQNAQQQEMVEADMEEYETVRAALERGVIQIGRVQDSRRDLNLSSTRLLETENNMLRVTIERENYERQLDGLIDDWETRLLARRDAVQRDLLENVARLTGAREELEANGLAPAAVVAEAAPRIVLHRRRGGAVAADMDAVVRPGDVIEATLDEAPAVAAAPAAAAAP